MSKLKTIASVWLRKFNSRVKIRWCEHVCTCQTVNTIKIKKNKILDFQILKQVQVSKQTIKIQKFFRIDIHKRQSQLSIYFFIASLKVSKHPQNYKYNFQNSLSWEIMGIFLVRCYLFLIHPVYWYCIDFTSLNYFLIQKHFYP